jgi:hypothetical protein
MNESSGNDEMNKGVNSIMDRGQKLKKMMENALDSGNAWEQLHGPHIPPKKYVPPFLESTQHDTISDTLSMMDEGESFISSPLKPRQGTSSLGGLGFNELKYIKLTVQKLEITHEETLRTLHDDSNQGFYVELGIPLPDSSRN